MRMLAGISLTTFIFGLLILSFGIRGGGHGPYADVIMPTLGILSVTYFAVSLTLAIRTLFRKTD